MGGHSNDGKILQLLRGVIDDMRTRTAIVAEQIDNRQLTKFFEDCARDRARIAEQVDRAIAELGAGPPDIERDECCPLADFRHCKAARARGDYGPLLRRLADCEESNVAMLRDQLERDGLSAAVRLAIDEAALIAQKTAGQYRRIADRAAAAPDRPDAAG